MDNGVYAAELWNPATGQWKTLAAQQVTRQCHSTACCWPITITASAGDSDGTVTKVEFFRSDGATKLGEDATAPYSCTWRMAPSGAPVLRARATDDAGAVTTSAPVTVRVRGLFG